MVPQIGYSRHNVGSHGSSAKLTGSVALILEVFGVC